MHEEIVIAGFGGQGVILAGKLLCEAAMKEGKQVVCSVSYGPEMRGGTASSGVIISDQPIGALVIFRPTIAVVMNQTSMDKYEPRVREGGILIINESLVKTDSQRTDIKILRIPATDLAAEAGNKNAANAVIIGALLAVKPVVSGPAISAAIEKAFSKSRSEAIQISMKALRLGDSVATQSVLATAMRQAKAK